MALYKRSIFGQALLDQLNNGCGYDPDELSRWAEEFLMEHEDELEPGLKEDLTAVINLPKGGRLMLSEHDLRRFAAKLIDS